MPRSRGDDLTEDPDPGKLDAFEALVRGRRMCRAFRADPLDPTMVERILDLARRAPSAGNTQPWSFLLLDSPKSVARYWDITLPKPKRGTFPWPGLLDAPVLVLPCVTPAAYPQRYAEKDKLRRVAASNEGRAVLSAGVHGWDVPYWFVDGGMAIMNLLSCAEAAGLGALFFGLFAHEKAVSDAFSIPAEVQPLGTVALGWPARAGSRLAASTSRTRPPLGAILHRGGW